MVETFDLPPNAIVACPKCGTKNSRTDIQCRSCDADLTEAKRAIALELGPKEMADEMPISFEQHVITRLERIESRVKENQGFLVVILVFVLIVLLTVIFEIL